MLPTPLILAAIASIGAAVPGIGQPAQLTVRVSSFAFAPSPIHLAAGKPVTLTFVNEFGKQS